MVHIYGECELLCGNKPEYEPFTAVAIISLVKIYCIKSDTLVVTGLLMKTSLELATAAKN